MKNLLNDLVKNRCDDNVQVLAKSLISLTIWCFNSLHQIILQVNEQPEMWNHQNQNVVLILNILNLICKENKTNCLLYIGRDILPCKLFINWWRLFAVKMANLGHFRTIFDLLTIPSHPMKSLDIRRTILVSTSPRIYWFGTRLQNAPSNCSRGCFLSKRSRRESFWYSTSETEATNGKRNLNSIWNWSKAISRNSSFSSKFTSLHKFNTRSRC